MVKVLKEHIDELVGAVTAGNLFPKRPTIPFVAEASTCCGWPLNVQKTHTRTGGVATLDIGEFVPRETVLVCRKCASIYISEELQEIVPPWGKFGYDVLVHVGKEVFLHCRQDKEIIGELTHKRIGISPSEIAYLAKRFIVYLASAHREAKIRIREAMHGRGGYILHLDGTCEGDSPHLMSALDGIPEIVLDNVKVPSESVERLIPFLRRIKQAYGNPLAVVSDMGKGILGAVEKVFPEVAVFICHFHFLRDIGKDLLAGENDVIRKRLKGHGIQGALKKKAAQFKKIIDCDPDLAECLAASLENGKIQKRTLEKMPVVTAYTLIQWALEGKKEGQGYGFPFDRPYLTFYERLQTLYSDCKKLQEIHLRGCARDNKPFIKVCHLLEKTINDDVLHAAALEMRKKVFVFDKLRKAMRLALPEKNRGLNDNGDDADIKTIEKSVEDFRHWLLNNYCFKENKDYQKMIEQIDKYWEKLFADPITVDTPHGKVTIQPQRTNNILERLFRGLKHRSRRKSGTNSLTKQLKAMLADTPLVKNLDNEEYLKIILNGKATLEERFAEIDAKTVREELRKSQENSEKIPPRIKAIIKRQELPQMLVHLFRREASKIQHLPRAG